LWDVAKAYSDYERSQSPFNPSACNCRDHSLGASLSALAFKREPTGLGCGLDDLGGQERARDSALDVAAAAALT
jgi:hypothetical protein